MTVLHMPEAERRFRLSSPHPSLNDGQISLRLPVASASSDDILKSSASMRTLSGFVEQQNARLREIESSLMEVPSSPDGGGVVSTAQRGIDAQAKARKEAIEDHFYELDSKLSQFMCPNVVAPKPPRRDGGGLEVVDEASMYKNRKALQRAASQRLYQGSGVGNKVESRAVGRVPPAMAVENRLNALRADDAARKALQATVEQHLKDIEAEHIRRAGGRRKDYLSENAAAAGKPRRPRSAPVERSASEIPLHRRPAFRPGGAPADLYERPGPPPNDYLPKRRPHSAMPAASSVIRTEPFRPRRAAPPEFIIPEGGALGSPPMRRSGAAHGAAGAPNVQPAPLA